MSIEKTYELIVRRFPRTKVESLEVVRQVEEYRQFWKPKEVKVVLLAESHVYTDRNDYEIKCNRSIMDKIVPNYPANFVRFVYCLGYGENKILERMIKDNTGTPQYWKIFSSCVAASAEGEHALGFHKVLKTQTPNLAQRLNNKISVLRLMQEKGIWLLDASIVGLYRSGIDDKETKRRIIEICWESHLSNVIAESNPKHIIVIGKWVKGILGFKLWKTGFARDHITTVPQPQARLNSEAQLENYKKYQTICAGVAVK